MRRSSWFTLAYVALVGAAGPLSACAGTNSTQASTTPMAANAQSSARTTTPAAQTGVMYSDMQVQNFVAARTEITALPTAQQSDQTRVGAILQRHSLAPDVYNAISTRSQSDEALANRIAAVSVGTNLTDAQLQAFARASAEINPLNQQMQAATDAQKPALAAQIREILTRNNLDLQTYNGLVTRSQSDAALRARIAALQPSPPPAG